MKKSGHTKPLVVLFVEGDTDKVFFQHLLLYYKQASFTPIHSCDICNLKGVSRYTSKCLLKLKNELIPEANRKNCGIMAVCCSYDTDVFEQNSAPIVDWKATEKSIRKLGISSLCTIQVKSSMEDWLLSDIEGLCRYLKITQVPATLKGSNGFEKIDTLFRKGHRRYAKGFQIESFIRDLDISIIRNKHKEDLKDFETALNVTIP